MASVILAEGLNIMDFNLILERLIHPKIEETQCLFDSLSVLG